MRFVIGCKPGEAKPREEKVAIIGAGPAGLAAAGYLRCKGFNVTVFDMLPEPGGLLIFGVLEIHVNKPKVKEGIRELINMGVEFKQCVKVGKDILLQDLIDNYNAVLIATGTWKGRRLNIPGRDLPEVIDAFDWIFQYHLWKYMYRREKPMIKPRVVVIGGGLTAIDAVHVSKWLGAKEIHLAYRRTRQYAPAGPRGFKEAEEEGAIIHELLSPVEYIAGPDGHLKAVKFEKMKLVPRPGEKRPGIEGTGEYVTIETDMAIESIGLVPTPPFADECCGIKLTKWGTIDVDEYKRTTREPVFAAGDVSHGPSLIGPALKSGLDAAKAIEKYLNGELGWRK